MKPIIAPSILSADFRILEQEINSVLSAGAQWIHIDVMDGHFVPNISMGPFVVETCKKITDAPLDVHLMIEKPERYLKDFAKAGADYLTVHTETCPHIHRTLQTIRELGCKAGITLNPGTPVEHIKPVLPLVDMVLVMSVNPGFSGQKFIPEAVEKVKTLRAWLDEIGSDAYIQVDGGITANNIRLIQDAGANVFVAASAVYGHPDGNAAGVKALLAELEH